MNPFVAARLRGEAAPAETAPATPAPTVTETPATPTPAPSADPNHPSNWAPNIVVDQARNIFRDVQRGDPEAILDANALIALHSASPNPAVQIAMSKLTDALFSVDSRPAAAASQNAAPPVPEKTPQQIDAEIEAEAIARINQTFQESFDPDSAELLFDEATGKHSLKRPVFNPKDPRDRLLLQQQKANIRMERRESEREAFQRKQAELSESQKRQSVEADQQAGERAFRGAMKRVIDGCTVKLADGTAIDSKAVLKTVGDRSTFELQMLKIGQDPQFVENAHRQAAQLGLDRHAFATNAIAIAALKSTLKLIGPTNGASPAPANPTPSPAPATYGNGAPTKTAASSFGAAANPPVNSTFNGGTGAPSPANPTASRPVGPKFPTREQDISWAAAEMERLMGSR